ncbi:pyridoxal-dependent decarboxylase [Pantoea phytobeneficialis]|uniref:Pyridoxal-dependent decarboxylase n=1 Tax=Pantoea phytobeneficialis TaxID=2052056 RepID=A0AAP9KRL6_9GAMM|nr:pyridoxal-dependent decarboxylase [Pantoea phytobeneficialis]MDO6406706.1 pyridoxal-dependent decarboxylase [Pantoea phytobeneficialis]QGR09236.1 pyridoxal-dependent decarboxylase [Pantoea phytobeneficialis]
MEKLIDVNKAISSELGRCGDYNPHLLACPEELVQQKVMKRLRNIYSEVIGRQKLSLGYPLNQNFDYSALAPFIDVHLNNLGDPYEANSTLLNTRELEQEVLEYFCKLWHALPRSPLTQDSFWGYVLSMGATEGNMYALWSAREYFSSRARARGICQNTMREPVLYYSQEAHYSLEKCANVLDITAFQEAGNKYFPGQCPVTPDGQWPNGVPVDQHGAVDVGALSALVDFFVSRGHPPIIVLNVGTTFLGGFDDAVRVWQQVSGILERHGCDHSDCWIHIDGALGAAYLPYLELASEQRLTSERGSLFDFRLPFVNSIVMSTHKWFGAPFASGVYMSKEKYRMLPATLPEYVDTPDTTLGGTRNGLAALILWYAINTVTPTMQAAIAARCEKLAAYAYQQMQSIKAIHPSFCVERGPQSLVVIFSRPREEIFNLFQLSGRGKLAHIVIMPHVTRAAIDSLITELKNKQALV